MCALRVEGTHDYKNWIVCIQYAHTILVIKFGSLVLYADPCLSMLKLLLGSINLL